MLYQNRILILNCRWGFAPPLRSRQAFFVNCCREVVLFRAEVGRCRKQITRWTEERHRVSPKEKVLQVLPPHTCRIHLHNYGNLALSVLIADAGAQRQICYKPKCMCRLETFLRVCGEGTIPASGTSLCTSSFRGDILLSHVRISFLGRIDMLIIMSVTLWCASVKAMHYS